MTREDVLSTLRRPAMGRLRDAPPSWNVEAFDGRPVIEAGGARFEVEVRPSDGDPVDDLLGPMRGEERDAFRRDLDAAEGGAPPSSIGAPMSRTAGVIGHLRTDVRGKRPLHFRPAPPFAVADDARTRPVIRILHRHRDTPAALR